MIVVRRKPMETILSYLAPYRHVLLLGCGTCSTVCFAGGEKETEELACLLPMMADQKGMELDITGTTCQRLCDWEFVEEVFAGDEQPAAVVSLACGVGHNLLANHLEGIRVFPGTDTLFMGATIEHGLWQEMCIGCGDCVLDRTFGICPVTRCTKSILNGPCGGSTDGKCEIDPNVDCGWIKIIERAQSLGQLNDLAEYVPPKDWSTSHHGGPRKLEREDLKIARAE